MTLVLNFQLGGVKVTIKVPDVAAYVRANCTQGLGADCACAREIEAEMAEHPHAVILTPLGLVVFSQAQGDIVVDVIGFTTEPPHPRVIEMVVSAAFAMRQMMLEEQQESVFIPEPAPAVTPSIRNRLQSLVARLIPDQRVPASA